MSGETVITIAGNLVAPAELRFTPSGDAVASFTVASTPRTFDKQSQEWRDGETLFLRCSAWREMAENIAESLHEKGTRVIVQGRLVQRSYETREGEKRTVIEMQADEVGPALRFVTATLSRSRAAHSGQQHQGSTGGGSWNAPRGGQTDDPWATGEAINTEPNF